MESIPISSKPLRARGKAKRSARIVSAAADLWREYGMDKVSLNQIAAAAEVAPQTVYNLVGGLDAIGFSVISLLLDTLDGALGRSSAKGTELALESVRSAVAMLTADEKLYRQLIVRVPRMLFEGTHLGRDLAQLYVNAVAEAQTHGDISTSISPERLGKAIYTCYLGALYDWACGDSCGDEFLKAAEIAVLAPLVGCATESFHPKISALLHSHLAR